jgi:hypothetical protein
VGNTKERVFQIFKTTTYSFVPTIWLPILILMLLLIPCKSVALTYLSRCLQL